MRAVSLYPDWIRSGHSCLSLMRDYFICLYSDNPHRIKIDMWFSDWIRNIRAGKKTSYVKSDREKKKEDDEDEEETEDLVALGII